MGDSTSTQQNAYQNSTAWASPYYEAQPLVTGGVQGAIQAYANNTVPNDFWAAAGNQAIYGMYDQIMTSAYDGALDGTMSEFADTFGRDGYNQTQRDALAAIQGFQNSTAYDPFTSGSMQNAAISKLDPLTRTTNNPALSGFASMAGKQNPYASQQNLSGIASGQYLNREDPNFERMLQLAGERAATEAGLVSSGMGRYGSGAHQGVVTRNVGDMEANARMGQYQYERNAQMQANQMLDAARAQQDATRLSALSGQASTYADDRNRQLAAINALGGLSASDMDRQLAAIGADQAMKYQAGVDSFNMGQQGMSNLASAGDIWSSLYSAQMQPWNDLWAMSQVPMDQASQLLSLSSYLNPYATQYQETYQESNQDTKKDNTLGTLAGAATLL